MANWKIKPPVLKDFSDSNSQYGDIVVQLLSNRMITDKEKAEEFLNPSFENHLNDPFLFKDMNIAVNRILKAIKNKEKVIIYGDYDADGVCSSVIVYDTLKKLGVDVDIYIPYREKEGYGLNMKAIENIISNDKKLIITVDCGITNIDEIKKLADAGIDTILTDHHQAPEKLPPALAIIDPCVEKDNYPYEKLSGAGVAYKLICALTDKLSDNLKEKLGLGYKKWLLDLVAVATIGDVCSLLGENRVFVKWGLVVLKKTKRRGFKILLEQIKNGEVDSQSVAWRLVPRLNAAGRMDHASTSFELLTTDNENKAEKLAKQLSENNKTRQKQTEDMVLEAMEQIENNMNKKLLYAVDNKWNVGLAGLVAGRIKDKYNRPTVIVVKKGEIFQGSGRSIDGFDITKALGECDNFLIKYGGHSAACGFKIKGESNYNKFIEKLSILTEKRLAGLDLTPVIDIDMAVKLEDVNHNLIEQIDKFRPFGQGNPTPVFAAYDLRVEQIAPVGKDGKHLRLMVSCDSRPQLYKLIGFCFGNMCDKINVGDRIDIAFEAGINEYNGNKEIQIKFIDIKKSF